MSSFCSKTQSREEHDIYLSRLPSSLQQFLPVFQDMDSLRNFLVVQELVLGVFHCWRVCSLKRTPQRWVPFSSHPIRALWHPYDTTGEILLEPVRKLVSVKLFHCEMTIFHFPNSTFGNESVSLSYPQVGQGFFSPSLFFFFLACRILVPQPRTEPESPAVEA